MTKTQRQSQQEQEQPPQRDGPPAGWRYYSQAKHRSWLRGWLARVWRGAKNNAALVSTFVALFGVLITLLINTWLAQQEQARQQALENDRAQRELALAEQQAQQESLQTYLGDMGEMLLRDTSPLRGSWEGSEARRLARAKTLTVLLGLDAQSKGILLRFLYESTLIQEGNPIVDLATADVSNADLSDADLRVAKLSRADLSGANLSYAGLTNANLSNADLSGAQGVTKRELEAQFVKLEGTTMPDGSIHD